MMTLFRDGGFPMYFILGFGFTCLAWAAWFAARGKPRAMGFVRAMMAATVFATAMGVAADLGATFNAASHLPETAEPSRPEFDRAHRAQIVLEGSSESMAPAIMGFALLAMTAFLLAIGNARAGQQA